MTSLAEFKGLRKLCIGSEVIYHPDYGTGSSETPLRELLPSSLQVLDISCSLFSKDELPESPRFAATRDNLVHHGLLPADDQSERYFSQLTHLQIECEEELAANWDENDRNELIREFASHGTILRPYETADEPVDRYMYPTRYVGHQWETRPLVELIH
ncbi:hypothetical protein BU23DRAFT_565554 [Bimuria novae-zelandiae CBS 107.79]|uniref:Uncharacterized protein n=1 Tax=Bimuria novae-zelandiae CBS 107.79 TaxID=1447943 RepID=A0A6A5VPQ8_9PLEO|nr:hypothetical protein BU23DRAFT_565554 [Bimuria novae-zelandiae CBS 107.79]